MVFYYDQFLDDTTTSMELFAQGSYLGENGTKLPNSKAKEDPGNKVWKSIATSIISVGDSVSGSVSLNWVNGSGNIIDSFMNGISEGTQEAMELLGKVESVKNSFQGLLNKNKENTIQNASNHGFMKKAQRKVYSASSFYPKYDGSNVSLSINPEFVFVTTSSNSVAIYQAKKMLAYMSPDISGKVGGGELGIRSVFESPPNGYYNTQSGITFDNYYGTFGLRIGTSVQFYPLLIDSYSMNVSTQRVKLSNGSYTPLFVKVSISLRPAGRFNGAHLYNMLTGDTIEVKTAASELNAQLKALGDS